jgi:phosphoserine phosphatase
MKLLLIRHGQTAWNREQVFRGGADIPLDRTGETQAKALARRLQSANITAVYSGPLARARRTAELIAVPHRLPVTILAGLDDMRFGGWEGKSLAEVGRRYPSQYSRWKTKPWQLAIPGGTTLRQIESRSWKALKSVARRHLPDDTIALVTHRVVLKLLILKMLGLGAEGYWRIAVDPCSLTVAGWNGKQFVLERFNDTGHIRPARPGADF